MKTNKLIFVLFATVVLIVSGCSSKKKTGADEFSESDLNYQRDARFGEGNIPTAEGAGMFRDVRFGYNSSVVDGQAMQDVEYNAQVLSQNPDLKIVLEGHCDERGTSEYNMSLGAQRARAVQEMLATFGVTGNRLETISYGEEVPLNPSSNEDAWSENRRVHFSGHSKG